MQIYAILIKPKLSVCFDRSCMLNLTIVILNPGYGVKEWMRWWQECFQTWPTKCNLNIRKIHSVTTNRMTVFLFYTICIYREGGQRVMALYMFPPLIPASALQPRVLHLDGHTHIVWFFICFIVMAVVI